MMGSDQACEPQPPSLCSRAREPQPPSPHALELVPHNQGKHCSEEPLHRSREEPHPRRLEKGHLAKRPTTAKH